MSAVDGCGTGRRLCRRRRGRSVDAKVSVHVEHSGARAAWRTRVAGLATRRRSKLPWFAGVEDGLRVLPVATAIDHMQLPMDDRVRSLERRRRRSF